MTDQIVSRSAPGAHARHHVKIRLVYLDGATPWKWRADCLCGWRALSWQWVAVDRPGGTLPLALEHLETASVRV